MRALHLVFLAGIAATPVVAQQGDTTSSGGLQVTLDEAIRRSLDVQPTMVQARGDQRNAAWTKRQALGAFLPTVTTNWGAARRWDSNQQRIDPNTGQPVSPVYIHTVGLSANLDLFDGFKRYFTLRASSAGQDAADAGYISQRFAVVLQTKQAFYTAISNQALVDVAAAQVRRAQQQLEISVQKLHAGSATRSDSLRSAVDLGNARLALLQAQANLATAEANLGRQIGLDGQVRATGDTSLPAFPDTSGLRSEAATTAPSVMQTEAQARAARAQVASNRSQYIPSLSVSYNDNRQGTGWPDFFSFAPYSENYAWQFRLSWTLFNGFQREQAQVSSSVARDIAEAKAGDARRQVSAQLTQQIAALGTAFLKIGITTDNVAASTEDLRVQQERYRVGAGTILDILTSQASLTQAQTDLVQARFDYLIARAQLAALVGHEL